MELAKRTTTSFGKDTYEKEEQQKIGGIDLEKFLFTYDKTAVGSSQNQVVGDKVDKHIEEEWKNHKSGYSYLADENGIIEYNGTVFSYNSKEDVITLGDMEREEDVKKIMEAIATDAKAKSKPIEVEKKIADTYEEMFDKKD